jgi:uncharacterized protein (TIGR03437 family)
MAIRTVCFSSPKLVALWHNRPVHAAFVATALFLSAGPFPLSAQSPFSTFLMANATVQGIGHDASGNIYVLGSAANSPIPGRAKSFFAARFDPNATTTTYFVNLGSGHDVAAALAVDAAGDAYITGSTTSSAFPVTAGFAGPLPAGAAVPFAIKLNPNGGVVYATLFGGAVPASPAAIAADSKGNVVITGAAQQPYTATPGAFSWAGVADTTFVTKLDPTGTKVVFTAAGVGGSQIALGPQGDIFVAGSTPATYAAGTATTPIYPTTPGAYLTTFTPYATYSSFEGSSTYSSGQYVTRLSADGTHLVYSTFLTGAHGSTNSGMAVDSAGNVYVTGTADRDYPFTTAPSATDWVGLFLTKLDPTGSTLVWSVPQGGSALALDANGNPAVGGFAADYFSGGFPPAGNTPSSCLAGGFVFTVGYVQSFNTQDGSTVATQIMTGSVSAGSAVSVSVEPDGRVLLAGVSLPNVSLSTGVVFGEVAAQPATAGVFLAAFDLSQPAAGPQLACVTDPATNLLVGPVAPGQLVTLFGYDLGPRTAVAAAIAGQTSFPTSLANVQVAFDGVPAPLLYASSGQINVQVPFEVANEASTVMTVSIAPDAASAYTTVAARMFAVTPRSPSLFLDMGTDILNQTIGEGPTCIPTEPGTQCTLLALNSDGSQNGMFNPAAAGSTVTIYLNGAGATINSQFPATGSITGSNPAPLWDQVAVDTEVAPRGNVVSLAAGDVVSLASSALFPLAGSIAGVDQITIQIPVQIAGSGFGILSVSIDDIAATPNPAGIWVSGASAAGVETRRPALGRVSAARPAQ